MSCHSEESVAVVGWQHVAAVEVVVVAVDLALQSTFGATLVWKVDPDLRRVAAFRVAVAAVASGCDSGPVAGPEEAVVVPLPVGTAFCPLVFAGNCGARCRRL